MEEKGKTMKEWFSSNELTKYPGFPFRNHLTVRKMLRENEIRSMIKGKGNGKRYYVHISAIEEYLNKMKAGGVK